MIKTTYLPHHSGFYFPLNFQKKFLKERNFLPISNHQTLKSLIA
jgi:hypothetical protein